MIYARVVAATANASQLGIMVMLPLQVTEQAAAEMYKYIFRD